MFNSIRNFLGFNEPEEYEEYYEGEIDNNDYHALYPAEMPTPLPEESAPAPVVYLKTLPLLLTLP